MPILTIFGHIDMHTAVGASIVSVIACSCGGAAPYLRGGLTNIRLAILLETATTFGALTGVLLMGLIPVPYLFFLFSVILFLSAQQMLARRGDPVDAQKLAEGGEWSASLQLDSSYPDRALGRDVSYLQGRLR